MLKRYVVLTALLSAVAFAQARPGMTPAGPAGSSESNSGKPDTMQVKSMDQVLRDSPRLSANLKAMLPADLTPQQACSGFKTLEQCVITIHAAQNLNLNFADLKARTTGKHSISLEKGIEQMAVQANPKEEVKKAKKQTSEDMKGVSFLGRDLRPRLGQSEMFFSS